MSTAIAAPQAHGDKRIAIAGALLTLIFGALLLTARFVTDSSRHFVEYPMLVKTDIPAAVAVARNGDVWFTLDFSDSIGLLRNGKIERFPKGRTNVEPIGLSVDSEGNAWFTDQAERVISRMSPAGEVKSFPLGTPIVRLGRLTVAPDNAVWFAESTAYSITKLKDNQLTRHVIQSARGGPYGIALDPQGNVWATLQHANQILRIDKNGEMQWFWVPTPASAPSDIAVDGQGAVWFLEYRTNKIGRLLGEEFTEFAVPGSASGLAGLAIAPDGSVWFGMLREHSLGRLRNGKVTKFPLPRSDARPCGVAVDASGNVWYVDIGGYVGMLREHRARAD